MDNAITWEVLAAFIMMLAAGGGMIAWILRKIEAVRSENAGKIDRAVDAFQKRIARVEGEYVRQDDIRIDIARIEQSMILHRSESAASMAELRNDIRATNENIQLTNRWLMEHLGNKGSK